jgi:hypothetical protein
MLEAFHDAPSIDDVIDCLRKLHNWRHLLRLEAEKAGGKADEITPCVWMVSAGVPETVLKRFGLAPEPGWPQGIYFAVEGLDLRLVVIPHLPETPDTLLLRLMGKDKVMLRALAEVRALPPTSWIHQHARGAVVEYCAVLGKGAGVLTPEQQEVVVTGQEMLRNAREEGRQEAFQKAQEMLQKAEEKGLEKGLGPLGRQFARRLGRGLDLSRDTLGAWLADPAAK